MFGYACRDTPELMPLPIQLAHGLARGLTRLREDGELPYLGPDGKSQVTVEYGERAQARRHGRVSTQHDAGVVHDRIRARREHVLLPISFPSPRRREFATSSTRTRPGASRSAVPKGDTGLTGRKIIVDTYGGFAPHGGGAFSGKDPSKVDRSAAYTARYVAKNVVAADLADGWRSSWPTRSGSPDRSRSWSTPSARRRSLYPGSSCSSMSTSTSGPRRSGIR